ncbi:hypothetical protein [Spirosoma litoris]
MERQLIPSRKTLFWLFVLAALLWYFWSFLFPKKLDNTDIVVMKNGHTMDATGFVYVGVKNVSIDRPSQYRDFLPKVAAQIADTTDEKTYIYFLMYDRYTRDFVRFWAPYQLEEEVPDRLLLMQHWDCGQEPAFVRWYIPSLKSLNTEVPDILHLEDTR